MISKIKRQRCLLKHMLKLEPQSKWGLGNYTQAICSVPQCPACEVRSSPPHPQTYCAEGQCLYLQMLQGWKPHYRVTLQREVN